MGCLDHPQRRNLKKQLTLPVSLPKKFLKGFYERKGRNKVIIKYLFSQILTLGKPGVIPIAIRTRLPLSQNRFVVEIQ